MAKRGWQRAGAIAIGVAVAAGSAALIAQGPRPETEPPIIVGDGSIYMRAVGDDLAWEKWRYQAPRLQKEHALSWTAPGNKTIRAMSAQAGTKWNGPGLGAEVGANWTGVLVIRYTDRSEVRVFAATDNGTGLTISCTRAFGAFRRRGDELRFGDENGPKVREAYIVFSDRRPRVDLCKADGPCRIGIYYQ